MLLARRVWNGGATKESKPRKNTSVRFQFILETASVFLLLCIIPSFQSVWFLFSVLPRRRAKWIVHTESESDKQKKAFHFHSVSWAGFVCVGVWMGVGVPKKIQLFRSTHESTITWCFLPLLLPLRNYGLEEMSTGKHSWLRMQSDWQEDWKEQEMLRK